MFIILYITNTSNQIISAKSGSCAESHKVKGCVLYLENGHREHLTGCNFVLFINYNYTLDVRQSPQNDDLSLDGKKYRQI